MGRAATAMAQRALPSRRCANRTSPTRRDVSIRVREPSGTSALSSTVQRSAAPSSCAVSARRTGLI